jgi:hypothetical protein
LDKRGRHTALTWYQLFRGLSPRKTKTYKPTNDFTKLITELSRSIMAVSAAI